MNSGINAGYNKTLESYLLERQKFIEKVQKTSKNDLRIISEVEKLTLPLESVRDPQTDDTAVIELKRFATKKVAGYFTINEGPVKLIYASPKREVEILALNLSLFCGQSFDEVSSIIDGWSYNKKSKTLKQLLDKTPNKLLAKIHYEFEIISAVANLQNLAAAGLIKKLTGQPPTPRFGYSIPKSVDKLGLADEYSELFDLSLKAYDAWQSKDPEVAEKMVLLGHRRRWRLSTDLSLFSQSAKKLSKNRLFELVLEELNLLQPSIVEWLKQPL